MTFKVDLSARVAIVTGAARGIGEATAQVLSQQGASVALIDIDLDGVTATTEKLRSGLQQATTTPGDNPRPHLEPFRCDVSKPAEIEAMVKDVIGKFGRVDILVNNAGICPRIPIAEMTEEWFDRIIGVNLKSAFFLTRAAAENMKTRRWGRIVNVSSTGGRIGGLYNATVYSASKGGILAMTKSMAREYASYNILINAVAPGAVDTPMLQMGGPEALQRYIDTVPLRRMAQPIEIARSITHLCSEETSWVTGATLDVNGGVVMV